jgi:hypothetical protein
VLVTQGVLDVVATLVNHTCGQSGDADGGKVIVVARLPGVFAGAGKFADL